MRIGHRWYPFPDGNSFLHTVITSRSINGTRMGSDHGYLIKAWKDWLKKWARKNGVRTEIVEPVRNDAINGKDRKKKKKEGRTEKDVKQEQVTAPPAPVEQDAVQDQHENGQTSMGG